MLNGQSGARISAFNARSDGSSLGPSVAEIKHMEVQENTPAEGSSKKEPMRAEEKIANEDDKGNVA